MKKEIILDLNKIGAVKFGEFTLKSGMISPIYIDLRLLISYPETLKNIASEYSKIVNDLGADLIAGIPYTALPIATAISVQTGIPMVYTRKEVKDYGTKKKIEGAFEKGQNCVVIDDLITNGESKFEVIKPLEEEGLTVKDIVVLVDREQGGKDLLKNAGYNLHSVLTIHEILETLLAESKISEEEYNRAKEFVENNVVKK